MANSAAPLFDKPNRLHNIDFAKGVLIYLMVIFHVHYSGAYPQTAANVYTAVYAFHMPAFLISNGLLINFNRPLKTQFYTLLRGLLIPYLLFEFVYITLLYFTGVMGFKFANTIYTYNLTEVLRYLFVIPIGAYWYLHTLIIGLAIAYIINKIFKNKTEVIVLTAVVYWAAGYLVEGFQFGNAIFIVLGMILNFYTIKIGRSWFSLVVMAIIFYVSLPAITLFSMQGIALSFLAISLLFQISDSLAGVKWLAYVKNYFVYAGRNTLIVVLIHPIFLNVLKPFSKYVIAVDASGISYLLLCGMLTVTFCLLCSKLFDATGVSRWLFGKNIYVAPAPV